MTTGYRETDARYTVSCPHPPFDAFIPSTTCGRYAVRDWSGADYPSTGGVRSFRYHRPSPYRVFSPNPRRSRRLDSIPHPYSLKAINISYGLTGIETRASTNDKWPSERNTSEGCIPLAPYINREINNNYARDGWTSNDDLALLGKLREAVAGSDFNAGVFLAELPEVLRLIGDTATTLARAYSKFRKGNFQGAADTLGGYGNRRVKASRKWLEMQYGWMPLLQDIEGGAQFLAQSLQQPVARVAVNRNARFYGWDSKNAVRNIYSYNSQVGWFGIDFSSSTGKRSKQIIAYLKAVDTLTLSGLTDPLSVAWELIPFSFVADWIIPIGSYLENLQLSRALSGTFVTTDMWKIHASGGRLWTEQSSSAGLIRLVPGYDFHDLSMNIVNMNRTVSTSLSIPLPSIKPLGKIASWKHCANALALLGASVR
jgi:hypothetical protein